MKRNYWPLFFISIFSFVFAMIIWTIYSATKVPIHKDETFLSSYQDVDQNYNKFVFSNKSFEEKYEFNLQVNKNNFGLVFKDMFLAQRVIEEKSNHKDIFKFGRNVISIKVKDKKSSKVLKDFDIDFRISRPTNHSHTIDFKTLDFKKDNGNYSVNIDLPVKGNWNITGQIKINNDIGYFYIKSNAI